ncbi:dTDP-4-dehydrorhamnose 3,5-epimerase family protein [Arenimonas aestuarii]
MPLPGLHLVESLAADDARGRFQRIFCAQELAAIRPDLQVAQTNLSLTRGRGSLRGLHYQSPPSAEWKLVRCLRGSVYDVVVDLRTGSPTFLRWHAVELAGGDKRALFIPEGFAHGFQVLEDEAELLYLHGAPWSPTHEGGLRHDDPRLGIPWPLPASGLSERDLAHPLLTPEFTGIVL